MAPSEELKRCPVCHVVGPAHGLIHERFLQGGGGVNKLCPRAGLDGESPPALATEPATTEQARKCLECGGALAPDGMVVVTPAGYVHAHHVAREGLPASYAAGAEIRATEPWVIALCEAGGVALDVWHAHNPAGDPRFMKVTVADPPPESVISMTSPVPQAALFGLRLTVIVDPTVEKMRFEISERPFESTPSRAPLTTDHTVGGSTEGIRSADEHTECERPLAEAAGVDPGEDLHAFLERMQAVWVDSTPPLPAWAHTRLCLAPRCSDCDRDYPMFDDEGTCHFSTLEEAVRCMTGDLKVESDGEFVAWAVVGDDLVCDRCRAVRVCAVEGHKPYDEAPLDKYCRRCDAVVAR